LQKCVLGEPYLTKDSPITHSMIHAKIGASEHLSNPQRHSIRGLL
jgi:hypothetical protein